MKKKNSYEEIFCVFLLCPQVHPVTLTVPPRLQSWWWPDLECVKRFVVFGSSVLQQDAILAHSSSLSNSKFASFPLLWQIQKAAAVRCFEAPEEDNKEIQEAMKYFLIIEKEKIATETFFGGLTSGKNLVYHCSVSGLWPAADVPPHINRKPEPCRLLPVILIGPHFTNVFCGCFARFCSF